jgi:hypothetical protein
MRGLRTQENKKFKAFFELVQQEAAKKGCVFFLDFGECQDIPFKEMEIDNLFGWCIPFEKVNDFEEQFLTQETMDGWDSNLCWCIPSIEDDHLQINFE